MNAEYGPTIEYTILNLNMLWVVFFFTKLWMKVKNITFFRSLFQNNYIKTSKYSVLSFLPLNLLEQFQRLANFYFLCLLILQLIPAISSLTPVTTAIPLIGVLMLTAAKDAYDDFVRISWLVPLLKVNSNNQYFYSNAICLILRWIIDDQRHWGMGS